MFANFHRIIGDKHVHDRPGVELSLLAVSTYPIHDRMVVLRYGDTCRSHSPGPFGVRAAFPDRYLSDRPASKVAVAIDSDFSPN
jgi:hypothetical protein